MAQTKPASLVGDVQFGAVGPELCHGVLHGMPIGTDRAVEAHFSVAALVGHGNHDGIFVDIEAHESHNLLHVLVSFVGGFG
jgi:hypothetical protein